MIDYLDIDRCLDLLEGYRVRPQAFRISCHYWDRLTMLARAGGYYGKLF